MPAHIVEMGVGGMSISRSSLAIVSALLRLSRCFMSLRCGLIGSSYERGPGVLRTDALVDISWGG